MHESAWAGIFSSFAVVSCWGYFLYVGVIDPNGGVNILWPLFGMSNQMLACIALTLATVIIYKNKKQKLYCLVTALPLIFITFTTTSAVLMKVFSSDVKIGFLASANALKEKLMTNQIVDEAQIINAEKMIFNQQLVAFIAMFFLIILWIVIFESVRKIFFGKK